MTVMAVEELTARIVDISHTVLGTSGIGADDDLADHGATSLSLVRILATLHQTLGVDVDPRELGGRFTARNLAVAAYAVGSAE